MTKRRILYYSEGWGRGGIESFIMSAARGLDRDHYEFEIFCTHDHDDRYDEEIADLGGKRYAVFRGYKPNLAKRAIASARAFARILAARRFDIVHVNTMNGMGFLYTKIAQDNGVPIRIAHSHSTRFGKGHPALKNFAHRFGKTVWGLSPTVRLACSRDAGTYLFGGASFQVIPNGIDVDRFRFRTSARDGIRAFLGISDDSFLVGSIGRITDSKNPIFQLDVAAALHRLDADSAYVMVGDGELSDTVDHRIDKSGMGGFVQRVPSVCNPEDYYCALDAFLFPSKFEGLAIASLEAQCSGLPVLSSDTLSAETDVTDLVKHIPLEAPADVWARELLRSKMNRPERERYASFMEEAGFSICRMSDRLNKFYASRI